MRSPPRSNHRRHRRRCGSASRQRSTRAARAERVGWWRQLAFWRACRWPAGCHAGLGAAGGLARAVQPPIVVVLSPLRRAWSAREGLNFARPSKLCAARHTLTTPLENVRQAPVTLIRDHAPRDARWSARKAWPNAAGRQPGAARGGQLDASCVPVARRVGVGLGWAWAVLGFLGRSYNGSHQTPSYSVSP